MAGKRIFASPLARRSTKYAQSLALDAEQQLGICARIHLLSKRSSNINQPNTMKLTFKLILAAVALSGGAFANQPAARLSTPSTKSNVPTAFAPAQSGHCGSMLVTNNSLPKGMSAPTYVDCNSPAVRNSPTCQRQCKQ